MNLRILDLSGRAARCARLYRRVAAHAAMMLVTSFFVADALGQEVQASGASTPPPVPVASTSTGEAPTVTPTSSTASTTTPDTAADVTKEDEDDTAATIAMQGILATSPSMRAAFTSIPYASTGPIVSPMAIAPGDPRYPLPAEPNPAGLILGTGGLVGNVGGALSPTLTSLLNPNAQYLSSGALNLAAVNVTGTFQTIGIGGLSLVNLTPASTAINGTLMGQNQHLTLLGGVTSASYITNINRGTDGFFAGGGGILLPSGAPAWSSDCASLLGIPLVRCWAVNPAQDNQVIVGDKATANGSQEVVIGRGASHTLPAEDANTVFPGSGRNDPNDPTGVPTNDFATRKGNSVVIGDSASGTANAQTIVGANATSSQVNSVALGNASVADRAAAAGYVAFGLAAPQTSVGAVSIGSTGNERQLTHVAAGTDGYDAVNVLQLQGAISQVSALDPLAVTYDPDGGGLPTNSVTLVGSGTGAVGVHNLAAGSLAAGSLDAVNGAQLNTTNQAVATFLGGTTAASPTGVFTAPTFNVTHVDASGAVSVGSHADVTSTFTDLGTSIGNLNLRLNTFYTNGVDYVAINSTGVLPSATGAESIAIGGATTASSNNAIAIGNGATASHADSIAIGNGSATSVGAETGYTAFGLTAPQTSLGEVNLGGRKVTGVAAGTLDTDVVNVAQLRAVSTDLTDLGHLAVLYDDDGAGNPLNSLTLVGDGSGTAVALHNLAAGSLAPTSSDAVNGAQVGSITQALASYLGGGAAFDPVTAIFTAPAYALRPVDAGGNVSSASFANAGDAFTSLDDSVFALNGRVNAIAAGLSPYLDVQSSAVAADATGNESIALGGAAQASGDAAMAAGTQANASGTGAVALGARASASVQGGVAIGSDSVADHVGGGNEAFSGVAVPVQGVVSVGSAGAERQIANVAGGSADTDAVNVRQLRAVADFAGSIGASAVQYDDVSHTSVTLNAGGAATLIGNLAAGSVAQGSAQAINGGQLWDWTQNASNVYSNLALYTSIQALQGGGTHGGSIGLSVNNSNNLPAASASGGNTIAVGAGSTASGTDSATLGNGAQATAANSVAIGAGSVADRANTVSVGAAGATRQVTNVAAGTAGTDAANVAQVNAVREGSVGYDTRPDGSVDRGNVTLGSPGAPTAVHNVAPGTAATDAANVGQLDQVADWSRRYTDERVGAIDRDIERTNNRASAGVASAMAMAGLPQATTPGRNMAAVAGGTFRGESGIAVGISTVTDGGGWVYKLSGSANSRGDAGFSVGAGMEW